MDIRAIIPVSAIDYPGYIATTIFTGGCNFRCPFCHNIELVLNHLSLPQISVNQVIETIEKRKKLVDALCITGGEPLIYDDVVDVVKYIKRKLHIPIKVDTNGSFPQKLKMLIEEGHINYVAMDIKTSMEKYSLASGVKVNTDDIQESINILTHLMNKYEFRTTVVPEYVTIEDIESITAILPMGVPLYGIQQYRPATVLSPEKVPEVSYPAEVLEKMAKILHTKIDVVEVRGLGPKRIYRKDMVTKNIFD